MDTTTNAPTLLFLMVLLVSSSQARQSFNQEPSYLEVNPGENAVMACRVFEKHRNSDCIWQKDGKPVRQQDGKYEWDGSKDGGDCSMRIIRADINYDDGMCVCCWADVMLKHFLIRMSEYQPLVRNLQCLAHLRILTMRVPFRTCFLNSISCLRGVSRLSQSLHAQSVIHLIACIRR